MEEDTSEDAVHTDLVLLIRKEVLAEVRAGREEMKMAG
jgi:hypothetical protein